MKQRSLEGFSARDIGPPRNAEDTSSGYNNLSYYRSYRLSLGVLDGQDVVLVLLVPYRRNQFAMIFNMIFYLVLDGKVFPVGLDLVE